MSRLDKLVRKVFPSTATLSRSAPFQVLIAIADFFNRRVMRYFTKSPLPPLKYIVRIGVGNTVFRPHHWYLTSSNAMWLYFFSKGYASSSSIILDIGSGVGRSAVGLRDFQYHGAAFEGHYHGVDVDEEMVVWCRDNFPKERFSFTLVDAKSSIYLPDGANTDTKLDVGTDEGAVDFVFSQSLFTHLLEDDLRNYLAQSFRVMGPGGVIAMTFFCIDDLRDLNILGGRWTFKHRAGAAYLENEKYPEAAVAYDRDWIVKAFETAGFTAVRTELPDFQSTIVGVKPE